ncbi:MAG: hypothetical protein IJA56_03500 [Clostridia bacterium]|nr:hypothetical protein [Clostridia bacterium]
MDRYSTTEWLRIATAGIVSPKEREQAKQELADHIFDHTEALLSTGLSRSQAQQQAVAAMGDPKAVGKHLRRVHQPILTKLLTICRRAAIVLAVVTVWVVFISSGRLEMFWQRVTMATPETAEPSYLDYPYQTDPLPQNVAWRMIAQPERSVRAGDYEVSVKRLSISYRPESSVPCYSVHMDLQFRPLWFWLEPASPVYRAFRLRSEGDWELTPDASDDDQKLLVNGYTDAVTLWGLFNQPPTELEVEYCGEYIHFTLPVDLSGGVVYEN